MAFCALLPIQLTVLLANYPSEVSHSLDYDTGPGDAVYAPVTLTSDDASRPVHISIEWGSPTVVRATGAMGVVTQVHAAPGTELLSGGPVMEVGQSTVYGLAAERPLYRDLEVGMTGEDVLAVEDLLVSMGYAADFGRERVDRELASAFDRFDRDNGFPADDGTFHRASVVWLGTDDPFRVASVEVEAGMTTPADGTPILTGPSRIAGATLTGQDERPIEVSGSTDYEVLLEAGSAAIPVAAGTADLALQSLELLQRQVRPDADGVDATLRRGVPIAAAVVPSSALLPLTADTGNPCIAVWSATEGTAHTQIEVEVLSAEPGRLLVRRTAELTEDTKVLVNPGSIDSIGDRCTSR